MSNVVVVNMVYQPTDEDPPTQEEIVAALREHGCLPTVMNYYVTLPENSPLPLVPPKDE